MFVLESWIFYPLTSNKFNDLLKRVFFERFLLCIHSRACFKMAFLAMRNRGKRCDRAENLIEEYEIQNSYSNTRHPLGNVRFKYDFHLFEFTL